MRYRLPLLIALAMADGTACSSSVRPGSGAAGAGTSAAAPGRDSAPIASLPPSSLPPTSVVTLDGASTDLSTILRGRAAVISLWATWCDACVGEIDALRRLDVQARARGDAIVVGVAVGETREIVAEFTSRRGIGYDQLVDEDFRLADALGQRRVPATLVVDRAGRIVFRGGALDAAGLAAFRTTLGSSE